MSYMLCILKLLFQEFWNSFVILKISQFRYKLLLEICSLLSISIWVPWGTRKQNAQRRWFQWDSSLLKFIIKSTQSICVNYKIQISKRQILPTYLFSWYQYIANLCHQTNKKFYTYPCVRVLLKNMPRTMALMHNRC